MKLIQRHRALLLLAFGYGLISLLLAGCKGEDPTLTAAPAAPANAKPVTPPTNKQLGEAAPVGESQAGGSQQATAPK